MKEGARGGTMGSAAERRLLEVATGADALAQEAG